MIFKPYYSFETGCAAYLFGCGGLGTCAVVDAHEEDVDAYLAFAASKGMRITHVIGTHVHADHRSGGPALARKAGATYCLHESANVDLAFEPRRDGQEIELGNTRVKVLHTPGHTPESASFVVTDLRRGTEPWFVLTGDTLFAGAVGRPDLPGRARENAGQLHESIHTKLLTLPGDLEVYPGHFSGSVCGAGMSGKPSSTIAFEKRWNPQLGKSRDECVDALTFASGVVVAVRMSETLRRSTAEPSPTCVEPMELRGVAGAVIIDVRSPEEFAAGHVEGAVNIPRTRRAGAGMSARCCSRSPGCT